VLLISILAGASERFIPTLIDKFDRSTQDPPKSPTVPAESRAARSNNQTTASDKNVDD
jgi:hypothetical protein